MSGKRGLKPTFLKRLYRLKYLLGIEDRAELAKKLGVKEKTVSVYEWRLEKKLANKTLQVSDVPKDLICPECGEVSFWRDPETGEEVCTKCGFVAERQADMVHRLPFDETYALESGLAFNKSLGVADTVRRRYGYTRILAKTRNNVDKVKTIAEILREWKSGQLHAEPGRPDLRGHGDVSSPER